MSLIEKIYLRKKNNLAFYDLCTRCKNRNYFEAVVKKKYKKKECCITILDLNDFKKVNDTNGHIFGDNALRSLVSTLKTLDGVFEVCRYGGDEFIVIHDKTCDIARGCNLYFQLTSNKFCWGTYFKTAEENVETALEKADKQLYRFKEIKEKTFKMDLLDIVYLCTHANISNEECNFLQGLVKKANKDYLFKTSFNSKKKEIFKELEQSINKKED